MKYQVESRFRSADEYMWVLDNEFDSLGEAISYASSEALSATAFEHRVTMQAAVVTIPALEDFV